MQYLASVTLLLEMRVLHGIHIDTLRFNIKDKIDRRRDFITYALLDIAVFKP